MSCDAHSLYGCVDLMSIRIGAMCIFPQPWILCFRASTRLKASGGVGGGAGALSPKP